MSSTGQPSESRAQRLLGAVAAVLLGVIFLLATAGKMVEPGAFVQQIHLEGLDFLFSAGTVVVLALVLEAGLGMALVLGVRHWLVVAPTAVLVAFFLFLTGRSYWLVSQGLRDEEAACGCFGSLLERTPAEAFWQDLLLLGPASALLVWSIWKVRRHFPMLRVGVAALLALAVGAYTWMSPQLQFSQAATDLASLPADRSYRKSQEFQLRIDGEIREDAIVYQSDGSVGMIVAWPQLQNPVLIDPPSRQFHVLEEGWSFAADGESLYLDSVLQYRESGEFRLEAGGIAFVLESRRFVMEMRY